jgi:hypothetical protein
LGEVLHVTHRIAGAVALALTLLAGASPASALTRLAAFAWTPATGPVAGYAVYASIGASIEELVASVSAPIVMIEVDSNEFVSVRVAAYDSTGREGPRSDASEPVRLCPGDFDGDEVLGVMDFADAQSCFGQPASGFCAGADLDESGGMVSILDLQSVKLGFEACASTACPGDFDDDRYIGLSDFGQARNCLGQAAQGACLAGDMDRNGFVSIFDVNYLASVIGSEACSL